ncbi:MAG: D-alanyl-D-alanine carboxypeptidase [Lachnospiraceae bacterium]|nr:D-alanyl-D-alanine carboxypeptidase [Lachnospiraceae bacterium]
MNLKKNRFKKALRTLAVVLGLSLSLGSLPTYASVKEDNILTNQAVPVESNQWTNWPTGPIVSAESAILMEADTGIILYEKNIHKQQYPASTTKILTTLIAIESCALDETVTFSYKATHDIDPGSNHVGIDADEQLPLEDCLKAILIRSANEVSFGVAEHIAGDTWEKFAPIMNERAKELGCLNSNFVNPNGLPNEEHVSTAYDLAMIGRAFFANELLCKMTLTKQLHLYPTENQPDEIWENNQMSLLPGKEYEYEYVVGCKTGYTNAARSCLVSCAEKDGMKLICVVLKDEAPYQYEDTIALFEYGFGNFEKCNVSQNETRYNIDTNNFFYNDNDIFGNSQALLNLNKDDYIILPKTAAFTEADSSISYDTASETEAAHITYTYHGKYIGEASIDFALGNKADYQFELSNGDDITTSTGASAGISDSKDSSNQTINSNPTEEKEEPSFFFINWKKILIVVGIIAGLLLIVAIILSILSNYQINPRGSNRRLDSGRHKSKRYGQQYISTDLQKKRKQQIAEAKRRQRRTRWR